MIFATCRNSQVQPTNPTCLRRLVGTADTEIQLGGMFRAALKEASQFDLRSNGCAMVKEGCRRFVGGWGMGKLLPPFNDGILISWVNINPY